MWSCPGALRRDRIEERLKPAQPLGPGHRGVCGRGRGEHPERRLAETALLRAQLGTLAERAAVGLLADEADRARTQLAGDRLEPLSCACEVGAAQVTRARGRTVGCVGDAEPELEQLELLARLEEARREARCVKQSPEVVARVCEVRSGRGGDTPGIDPAEDRLQPRPEDVRNVRLRLLPVPSRRSSLRRGRAAPRRRRWSRSGRGVVSP